MLASATLARSAALFAVGIRSSKMPPATAAVAAAAAAATGRAAPGPSIGAASGAVGDGALCSTRPATTSTATSSATSTSTSTSALRLRGVVFDMDGTLTVPCIDFAEMRRRVGVQGRDILHEIEGWPAERRAEAYRVIGDMEAEAKAKLQIMPGAEELCAFLDARGIRRGLITRNVKDSVDHFHTHFQGRPFHPALSREFRPYKPDPGPLLHICQLWGFPPETVLMIGDSHKDDVICGRAAGALTCLLDELDQYSEESFCEGTAPHFRVQTLTQFLDLLRSPLFELVSDK